MTLSRRQFGRGIAALSVASGTAACGIQTGPDPALDSTAKSYRMDFGPRPAGLPHGGSIRLLSGGPGGKSAFFHQLVPNYQRVRGLRVAYDELPNDKISEVLPLQLRNGQADDIFQVIGVDLNGIASAGQVLALEDVIPGFAERARQLPFGVLVPGVNQFNGKTYMVGSGTGRRLSGYLIYNTEIMHRAGYDPSPSNPLRWSELRAAAKKCTKQGRGKYYGLLLGDVPPATLGSAILESAQLAGAAVGGGINWKTGQYNYSDDAVVGTIEYFQQMQSDGSIFPGWVNLTDQEARARMPLGQGAMLLNGPWNYSVWAQQNPTFKYSVAPPPLPDHGPPGHVGYAVGGGNAYAVFSRVKPAQRDMAGDLLRYLISDDGQRAWALLVGSSDPVWSPPALAAARNSKDLSAAHRQTFAMYDSYCRLLPSPMLRNPAAGQVQLELAPVSPAFGDIFQGVMLGNIKDVRKALVDLDRRSEKALEDAIAAAGKKGSVASRDDWKFPDWDPATDFGQKNYSSQP